MTKWCNNCEEQKHSWGVGYKCDFRCWSCDKWSLVYDSDKKLYDWWLNGIDSEQKNIIEKFGVDASSSSKKRYAKSDLLKLWYWHKILEKNRWDIDISGKIRQINFFSTDWNNNLATFISERDSSYYGINLLVYEMPMQATGGPSSGNLEKFFVSSGSSLYEVRNKVKELEKTLKGDNPILYKWPCYTDVFYNYSDYNSSSYPSHYGNNDVKRIELSYHSAKNNPDNYIKPLDIVKKLNQRMVHTGVYLGDRKVAHAKGNNRVEIDNWDEFFNVDIGGDDKLLCYHPVVAFKKPEKIIEHIAKTVTGRENYFCVKGNFSIAGNNCENFANRCVLGLNFSELADRKKKMTNHSLSLSYELKNTNNQLDGLSSYPSNTISEIEGYRNRGNENRIARKVDREGIEMQNCIEVQPKGSYSLRSPTSYSSSSSGSGGCPIQ